jgi:hypothetical protein
MSLLPPIVTLQPLSSLVRILPAPIAPVTSSVLQA